eukprot:7381068-Prymnesium_polylepis.2
MRCALERKCPLQRCRGVRACRSASAVRKHAPRRAMAWPHDWALGDRQWLLLHEACRWKPRPTDARSERRSGCNRGVTWRGERRQERERERESGRIRPFARRASRIRTNACTRRLRMPGVLRCAATRDGPR